MKTTKEGYSIHTIEMTKSLKNKAYKIIKENAYDICKREHFRIYKDDKNKNVLYIEIYKKYGILIKLKKTKINLPT